MTENQELLKLSLQFFGAGEDDEDFDDYYDEDDYYDDGNEDPDLGDDQDDSSDSQEDNAESENGADSALDDLGEDSSGSAAAGNNSEGGSNDIDGLLAELRAQGIEGDNISAMTEALRTRRLAQSKGTAKNERAAINAASKKHVKAGGIKGGGADATEMMYSERDIREVQEALKCTREVAKQSLERQLRAMSR